MNIPKINVNKVLLWTVKGASLITCAPVTWKKAEEVLHGGPIAQAAGVVLVEGVLLSNWTLLETDKNADPAVKSRYALTSLAMYFGICALAVLDGEGVAGLVFRGALGAALLGSMWDTLVDTWKMAVKTEARDITKSFGVSRHAAKVAKVDARSEIDRKFAIRAAERQAELDIELARIATHRRTELDKYVPSAPVVPPVAVDAQPDKPERTWRPRLTSPQVSAKATDDDLLDIYRTHPAFKLRDTEAELKRRGTPLSRTRIGERLKALEADGKVHLNGQVTVL